MINFELEKRLETIEDEIKCLRNMINANYKDFANYAEQSPKSSDQWMEERMRSLELQVKELIELLKQIKTTTVEKEIMLFFNIR
jgi:hypothetical protein